MGFNFATIFTALIMCWGFYTANACNHTHSQNSSDSQPHTSSGHCTCPPKPVELLAEQFNNAISNTPCVHLSRINVPILDGSVWTSVYVITTDVSCLEYQNYDSRCFGTTSLPHCSSSQNWIDLGADFFPRFVSNVECRGSNFCSAIGRHILELNVLRRQNQCDQNGEVWQMATIGHNETRINVSCDCLR